MPFIRFKRWNYLTPLAPHVAICDSGHRYVWTGAERGAVSVPHQADVAWLLNSPGEAESVYELAYERHGIVFDATGTELTPTDPPRHPATVEDHDESVPTPRHQKPGRPKR